MRDLDVRRSLRALLSEQHTNDGSLIVDELWLLQGRTRVDLAIVNGELSGYEIKSASDTLQRLDHQRALYSEILDRVWLVASTDHLNKARDLVPRWWGLVAATQTPGHDVSLRIRRRAGVNPEQKPLSIAQLLWREEAVALITVKDPSAKVKTKPKAILWNMLVERYTLAELKDAVRSALKSRLHWRDGAQRASNGG